MIKLSLFTVASVESILKQIYSEIPLKNSKLNEIDEMLNFELFPKPIKNLQNFELIELL